MSLCSAYDTWHQRIYEADPSHDDLFSPWHRLVGEYMGEVAGLRVLEVARGRGSFVRHLANAGAHVSVCDFCAAALQATRCKLAIDHEILLRLVAAAVLDYDGSVNFLIDMGSVKR